MTQSGLFPKIAGDLLWPYDVNGMVRNITRGILPTTGTTVWATPMTSLVNITDGDITTTTNLAIITGQIGSIDIALGGSYIVDSITLKLQGYTDGVAASNKLNIQSSFDGVSYSGISAGDFIPIASGTAPVYVYALASGANRYARFIRLSPSANNTINLCLHEISVIGAPI